MNPMSKKPVSNQGAISDDEEESYEVEKIVNHRVVGDKKEYKVIWAGYSFEEATWEPEENLKCPEKIQEFLKRYEEVVKKKKMMKLNPQSTTISNSSPNIDSLSKPKPAETPKVGIDKSQPIQQQRPQTNQASILNREKLQASMEKNNLLPQKKPTDIDNLKSKIMSPQLTTNIKISPDHSPTQNRQVINTADLFSSPKMISTQANGNKLNISKDSLNRSSDSSNGYEQTGRLVKLQNQSSKLQNSDRNLNLKIEDKIDENLRRVSQQFKTNEIDVDRRRERNPQFDLVNRRNLEERKISHFEEDETMEIVEQSAESYTDSLIFMKSSERMDIEAICGIAEFEAQFEKDGNREGKKLAKAPEFLVVKNKYSEQERLVEKERVIIEQPMKLIEFYEKLLMDSMKE